MNIKMIFHTIGKLLILEAILMILPLIISFIYEENTYFAWLIPITVLLLLGFALIIKKPHKTSMFAKDGMALVGLSWVLISFFGCIPFVVSKQIPNFIDALFETISGFTTTGSSILTDIEGQLTYSMKFWRSFTHWIGGMGILVFVLAFLPNSEGQSIFILRAESTGPSVGKLVSKVKATARILYLLYFGLSVLQVILHLFGGLTLFEALVTMFGTAGTGGFGIYNDSLASYSNYNQIVTAIFMILFGINFNVFYLIVIGKFSQAFKNEELWAYLSIMFASIVIVTLNIYFSLDYTLGLAIKDAFFQVSSIMTSTGYVVVNYNTWPELSKIILFFLMFIGACAGSTGGGIKVSRFLIIAKAVKAEIKKLVHPHSVSNVTMNNTRLDGNIVKSTCNYFVLLVLVLIISILIVSINGFDFETTISSVVTCSFNVGPGLGNICGAVGNFSSFSGLSKVVLMTLMLIGRLEIYPILILFVPKAWANK